MAISPRMGAPRVAVRDHGFHSVRIKATRRETADATTFVLAVPDELRPGFAYRAGQFVTFRVRLDGHALLRCYSMSSAPEIDPDLEVTVKRVPGGVVSNWMIDTLAPGDAVEVTYPSGVFCLGPGDGEIAAFAAGSGITPVLSVAKSALATTRRPVRLLYANRDRQSAIFAGELERLARQYPGRLDVVHHLDVERGFVAAHIVRSFVEAGSGHGGGSDPGGVEGAEHFICGPPPFMDIVEAALSDAGADPGGIRIERFSPVDPVDPVDPGHAVGHAAGEAGAGPAPGGASDARATEPARVTITLDGRVGTADHRAGTTILQTARQMGMAPPFSCESGNCATCMAKVVEGAVTMHVNNALTPEEVDDGWVLTCQAVPTTPSVGVVYGDEEA